MIDHLSFYATDYPKTQRFYEQALAPLGARVVMQMSATWNPDWPEQRMCAFGVERPIFWIAETRDAATHTFAARASRGSRSRSSA